MPTTPSYHWTPANQRGLLECLEETGSIAQACAAVSMSRRSADNLRFRKDGAAFRLGWEAAILMARARTASAIRRKQRAAPGPTRVERAGRDHGKAGQ